MNEQDRNEKYRQMGKLEGLALVANTALAQFEQALTELGYHDEGGEADHMSAWVIYTMNKVRREVQQSTDEERDNG